MVIGVSSNKQDRRIASWLT